MIPLQFVPLAVGAGLVGSLALWIAGLWLVVAIPYPIIPGPIAGDQFLLGGAAMVFSTPSLVFLANAVREGAF